MKKILLVLVSLLALVSCKDESKHFVIEGTIADTSCDGAQIFLVPLTEPATHETVDSVVIKDRKFRFEGDEARICALRLQMPQRMNFQELLVYTEPGNIEAFVSQHGSVTGTKNNDLLQEWKTIQERCFDIRNRTLDEVKYDYNSLRYHNVLDSLNRVMGDATYDLLKKAGINPITRFFYAGNKTNLSPEQRADLQNFEDDYIHQQDSIRKARAAEQK